MGVDTRNNAGRPRNTFKRDYDVYLGVGMGAVGAATVSNVTRATYWVDHNPFAAFIRRMIFRNADFTVYTSGSLLSPGFYLPTPGTEVDLYISADAFNDRPDEMYSAAEVAARHVVKIPAATRPPYSINVTNIQQPLDPEYNIDQGRFTYNAYSTSGYGISKTGQEFVAQAVVPTSPVMTAVALRLLYKSNSVTDNTQFRDVIIELWDSSRKFYANLGVVPKKYSDITTPGGYIDTNGNKIKYAAITHGVADDSVDYWTNLAGLNFTPAKPIKVVPGATYYIVARHLTPGAATYYGLGANVLSSGVYNGLGRYIFGSGFLGAGVSGANTLTGLQTNVNFCFLIYRNTGRTAFTFWWGNPAYLWHDPANFPGQFEFVKEDFDQVEI